MKFGRQLETYKIPEWFEYYLDYNGLKTVLKFLDIRPAKRKKLIRKIFLLFRNQKNRILNRRIRLKICNRRRFGWRGRQASRQG